MTPHTVEGAYLLHQFFQVDWNRWRELDGDRRKAIAEEAGRVLEDLFTRRDHDEGGAAYHVVGHKADLALVHLRQTPEELHTVERRLAELELYLYLSPTWSYLSVIELSVHGVEDRHGQALRRRGVEPDTPEWEDALEEILAKEKETLRTRLYPDLPPTRYLCFYPMNKLRGEQKNWFMLPTKERGELMRGHARVGRKYKGKVQQIISSSVGLDDWEWGVDLFADDALQFKKLVYEMRFDEVSAVYAQFGTFLLGVRADVRRLVD